MNENVFSCSVFESRASKSRNHFYFQRNSSIGIECKKLMWFATISILLLNQINAQEQPFVEQIIEAIMESQEGNGEFDYNDLGELIDDWHRNPVNLNTDEVEVFVRWNIISEFAYRQLKEHITRNGPLLSPLELQSIRGFDIETIRVLQHISEIQGRETFTQTATLGELFVKGQNEIYVRAGRTIEKAKGYDKAVAYEGSPDRLYLRLRHRNAGTLSYGITAEKDAGEALFKKSNAHGFDFYSGHIALVNYRTWLPALILGDFSASFGQGLIMHSGYGAGKGSLVTSIKRSGFPVKAFTSVDENNFLRGAACTVKPSDKITITAFLSHHDRDGNLIIDTISNDNHGTDKSITSLQTSGLHRTSSEIADENALTLTQGGINIKQSFTKNHVAFNALYNSLSVPLQRSDQLYNRYYFNGSRLINASIDYAWWIRGIHFFGETAISDNGGLATIHGLMAGLDKHIVAAVLFRKFDRHYQALTPNIFGESSTGNNESGIYTGVEITPDNRWKLQLYHDIWSHPWLRYNVDMPTHGQEYFAKLSYTLKRRLEVYTQYKHKHTYINNPGTGQAIPDVISKKRAQIRIHINNILAKSLQLRSRMEWSFYRTKEDNQQGVLLYQDVIYKPLGSPWSLSARVTLFDTDDFDSRIYAYENDLIYYYSIPPFSDRGTRYYINLRYKGIRNLTAEVKIARTKLVEATSIGSGNDQIDGNHRTEVRAQVIYRFER